MKRLLFKTSSDHLLLCVFLSLLWGVTDSTTTSSSSTQTTTTVTSAQPTTKPAPGNVEEVRQVNQTESSITLTWDKVNDIPNYTLQFYDNGIYKEKNIDASSQGTSVIYVVSPLTAGTKYSFTLFTVLQGVNSAGYNFTAVTAPRNVEDFKTVGQNETSITLQWKQVNGINWYVLAVNGEKINITSSAELVTHTVPDLSNGTRYEFSLFTVFENIRSSGVQHTAVTAPRNVEDLRTVGQNETSITLQWKQVNGINCYILVVNGEKINVTSSAELVTHTVPDLSNGTRYEFSLFTVFENIRSSGVQHTAVTAPRNVEDLRTVGQNETSITLQWKQVNGINWYILAVNKKEINVTSSAELVTHTVPDLSSGTKYEFSLFTVFENIRSSGVQHTAVTAPRNVEDLRTVGQNETSITLQWKQVNGINWYILGMNEEKINVTSTAELVTHTVPNLSSGTRYEFSLFTVFENIRSSGVQHTAVTAPRNVEDLRTVGQNETSITLQWKQVNGINWYILGMNEEKINVTSTAELVTHTVPNLSSGTRYEFSLFTVFENIRSSGVQHTAVTAPRNVEDLRTVGQNETSITLQWKQVNGINWYILGVNEEEINVTSTAELVTHTVPDLSNGTRYEFSLFTVFENIRSSGVQHTAVTAPGNVKEVTTMTQTESTITLTWDKVNNIPNYTLQYYHNGIYTEKNIDASSQGASVEHVVSPLTPGIKYSFTLSTVFEGVNSTEYNFTAVTVPPMVSNVSVTNRSVTSVTLTWKNVNEAWKYLLEINGQNETLPQIGSSDVSHSVTSLKPGTKHAFSLITMFSGLNSTPFKGSTVTAIDCASVKWHVTNSSIQGTVEGLFTNAIATYNSQPHVSPGGGNVSFTDLVSGATYEISLEYETSPEPLNQCRHNLTVFPSRPLSARCEYWAKGYSARIVWAKPNGVWTAMEVNVTGQSHKVGNEDNIVLQGFQPARTYQVSLNSVSGNERRSESFIFLCSTDPRGVIAGSVFAVLLFCLLVCLAVFIFLKRPDIISSKKSFISGSKQTKKKSNGIPVAQFPHHFNKLHVDENRGFSEEYEGLASVGTNQTQKAADLPQNKVRNRFKNVLPYDWCRVKLSTINGTSDYINASYMPGYNSNREYIATQGPIPGTVNDFWRMIWEQRVNGIVMVTNCTEGGKLKCERYWPADSKPCCHGELLVTMRSEQQGPNWTLREFTVKHRATSEERSVKHFHFTAWPDHGVPEGSEVLIQFRELVRRHIEKQGSRAPTVVHCSAGVGRTGTIIALDVLLQQLEKDRAVGIEEFVHKMRLNRPHMVQTESQYVFLHQCILDSLQPNQKPEECIYENADLIYENATALRELG